MNALNPVLTVADQMRDACRAHSNMSNKEIEERSREVLRLVSIDPIHLHSYPHQLSGGMRQRAMIAMALLFTPELVIMDEPTSALDVVAQRSLMVQIKELQGRLGFAVIFVTHDMSLVSHFSDRLLVMYAGQVAELAASRRGSHPSLLRRESLCRADALRSRRRRPGDRARRDRRARRRERQRQEHDRRSTGARHQPTSGEIWFEGRPLSRLRGREQAANSGDVPMVFQDPYSSINPAIPGLDTAIIRGTKLDWRDCSGAASGPTEVEPVLEAVGLVPVSRHASGGSRTS